MRAGLENAQDGIDLVPISPLATAGRVPNLPADRIPGPIPGPTIHGTS